MRVPLAAYVGERDPKDPSAFRISYSVGAARGYLVGHLRDDDRVEIHDASSAALWNQLRSACAILLDD
jgi:hypothetical protein